MPGSPDIPFGPGPLRGLRVLVAEDNPFTAETLSLILEEEGARLLGPCKSVADACALLEREQVQFVLIDRELSDAYADDLANAARDRGIPFAVITGYAALPTNAFDRAETTFRKPINRRRLIDFLSRYA